MIEVSLSLIGREVTKILPKIRFHWDMKRTVEVNTAQTTLNPSPYNGSINKRKGRNPTATDNPFPHRLFLDPTTLD